MMKLSLHIYKIILTVLNSDHKIEVINAGISNGWSFNEVKQIRDRIITLQPDLLIIYDGWNDAEHEDQNFYWIHLNRLHRYTQMIFRL